MASTVAKCGDIDDLFGDEFSDKALDRWKKNKAMKNLVKELHGLSSETLLQRLEDIVVENCKTEEELCALKYSQSEDMERRDAQQRDLERVQQQKVALDKLLSSLQKKQKEFAAQNRKLTEQENQRRQDIARQVQSTISDVKNKMEEQASERLEQAKETEELRMKFRALVDQYEAREKVLATQQQAREQEVAQLDTMLQNQEHKASLDTQRSRHLRQANKVLQYGEVQLRAQLKQYGEKLAQFQKTLHNSHSVFHQYKSALTKLKEGKKRMDSDKERFSARAKEVRDLEVSKVELEERCRTLRNEA